MTHPICPICRERHEARGLSFDGKGINSCGMYRLRLATFLHADYAAHLGPLFAAAPDLLAALKGLAARFEATGEAWMSDPAWVAAADAIRKAEGGDS